MTSMSNVVGLAPARSEWFAQVERWSQAGAVPFAFIRCVSPDDLRRRAAHERTSIALIDEASATRDLALIDDMQSMGCSIIIVTAGRPARNWASLGIPTVLALPFDRDELVDALDDLELVLESLMATASDGVESRTSERRGTLVAVTGVSGSGTSTMARALAGAHADRGAIALVDAAPHADQALLHDLGDVVPGLPELVDLHRRSTPTSDEVTDLLWSCPRHGYDLLPGLRRPREWTLLRRRPTEAMLDSLLSAYDSVIVDCDHDLDGERETGSIDIEERNVLSRTFIGGADAIVVTTRPGIISMRRCVALTSAIVDHGVEVERLVVAVVDAPRATTERSRLSRDITLLLRSEVGSSLAVPVMVPRRRELDSIDLDGGPLPAQLSSSVVTAIDHVLASCGPRVAETTLLRPIRPGSLGMTA